MSEQKIPKDKWSLRNYLKRLDLYNPQQLEMESGKILEYVRNVMGPYVRGERGEPLREYYAPVVELIESSYKKRDFKKELPEALESMIGFVDWE